MTVLFREHREKTEEKNLRTRIAQTRTAQAKQTRGDCVITVGERRK